MRGRKQFGHYRGEPEIIVRMEQLRAEGLGFDRIAERLNVEEVPTRSGKPWSGLVINRILTRTARRIDSSRESAEAEPAESPDPARGKNCSVEDALPREL